VHVAANYRLGCFGWLAHAALLTEEEQRESTCGNYGLADLVCALQWVRDHVHHFGQQRPSCHSLPAIWPSHAHARALRR
jgi:carboxylesterase type B